MKKKLSITLNILIIIFEIVGFMIAYNETNRICIEYYTEDSNLLALISASLYIVFVMRNKKIPKLLSELKYVSGICLTITFFVVLFILAPIYNYNYYYFLLHGSMLFHHFLCPILFVLTLVCFDKIKVEKNDIKKGIIPTVIYGVIMIILNLLKLIDGPYPFLRVYSQPIYVSFFWLVLIFGLAYGISVMLYRMYRR